MSFQGNIRMGKDRNFLEKPNIIAEIANSHGGNYEKALEIIESIPFEFVNELIKNIFMNNYP